MGVRGFRECVMESMWTQSKYAANRDTICIHYPRLGAQTVRWTHIVKSYIMVERMTMCYRYDMHRHSTQAALEPIQLSETTSTLAGHRNDTWPIKPPSFIHYISTTNTSQRVFIIVYLLLFISFRNFPPVFVIQRKCRQNVCMFWFCVNLLTTRNVV